AAALDFHIKGPAHSQTIQNKPLLAIMDKNKKSFPGGKEFITKAVKGEYTSAAQGYSHDDQVSYANPANMKRAQAPWYELHCGISFTLTELKKDGISVVDSTTGGKTTKHSDREMTVLSGLLEDKMEDMS